jgi:hypothetical protein
MAAAASDEGSMKSRDENEIETQASARRLTRHKPFGIARIGANPG